MCQKEILKSKDLCKIYGQGEQAVHAVENVNLAIHANEFCVITGKSGSGKSTLLRMLSGIEHPSSGQVYFDGADIYSLDNKAQANIRGNHFGFVFQAFNLIPELSVFENIALPRILNRGNYTKHEIGEIADELGITQKLNSYPHQLSGGQQQRVALARAFINNPTILFADEPTGNLDEKNRDVILIILKSYSRKAGKTVVMVTHEKTVMEQSDVRYNMRDGVVE